MHNWDYPKNKNTKKNEKWFLERLLNYCFLTEKIYTKNLKINFSDLSIPEHTKAFFELLLWNKPY